MDRRRYRRRYRYVWQGLKPIQKCVYLFVGALAPIHVFQAASGATLTFLHNRVLSLQILLIWAFPQLTAAAILRQDSALSIRFKTSTRSSRVRIVRFPVAAILIMVWISPRFHFSQDAHQRKALFFLGYGFAGGI